MQCNFRNEQVEAQRNYANAERPFCTKLKRTLTSAIEISLRNANTAFFAILNKKKSRQFAKKGRHLSIVRSKWNKIKFMYKIALLTEKSLKAKRNRNATNSKDFDLQRNFCNVSKQKIKAQSNFRNCGSCASKCALPTSGI